MRTHSLYSQDEDRTIIFFEKFDKIAIRTAIIERLTAHPTDTIEHCREYSKEDAKKYYGNEILNIYGVNPKNGKPSIITQRGYKALSND